MDNELLLTEELNRNYEALQNYRNGVTLKRRKNRRSGAKYGPVKVRALEKQDWRCKDCSRPFKRVSDATADHVIPFRYGGTYKFNHEYVCERCNHDRESRRAEVIKTFFRVSCRFYLTNPVNHVKISL